MAPNLKHIFFNINSLITVYIFNNFINNMLLGYLYGYLYLS